MTTPATVQQPEAAPDQEGQGRSTIKFPYLDQDDAVDLAKKIWEISGKSCEKAVLAAAFGVVPDGGGFNLRVGTAKTFGLISGEKKVLSLTPLGERIVDPAKEKGARAESFLQVQLYKSLYGEYEGKILPGNPGLEAHIEKLGVAPKQRDKARQVFQRSATQAGYFAFGSNRLVAPQFKQGAAEPADPPPAKPDTNGGGGGNGGGKDEKKRHPFIEGLLDTLPPVKGEWTQEGRQQWLQTAAGIFNLIYKASESDAGILVVSRVPPPPKDAANEKSRPL
jgi:hypothetical protein